MKKRLALIVSAFLIVGLTFGMSYMHKASATAPGVNQMLSQDASGTYANNNSSGYDNGSGPYVSGDGRYVAFDSRASNLVSDDTNGYPDVLLKDTSTGAITRVSVVGTNTELSLASKVAGMSYDGRYVLFFTDPGHLLLVRDTVNNTTINVRYNSDACYMGSFGTTGGAISADGKYVTYALKVDSLAHYQVVVENIVTHSCKVLSSTTSGTVGNADSYPGGISCDGGVISFYTDSGNLPGGSGGYLASVDTDGTLQLTKVPTQKFSQVSCDGNKIASWTSGNTAATEYDRLTGQSVTLAPAPGLTGLIRSVSLSDDGRFAAVNTTDILDTSYPSTGWQGKDDIYVVDTKTSTTELLTFTVAGNRAGGVPYLGGASISADGSKVAYIYPTPASTDTSHELIAGLTTGTSTSQYDIYTSKTGY